MSLPPAPVLPTKDQFQAALREIEIFSPAPVILGKAIKLLNDPQADVDSIAGLVSSDPALMANLIRCANSAYYGGGDCKTMTEAMQKLGTRETVRLLNLAVAKVVGGRDLNCYGIRGADYWAECLFNGLFMQGLAKASGAAEADEAYTVGLLRFIGRLAINQTIEHLRGGLFWSGSEPIGEWELQSVGLKQGEAGATLLRKWRFPETMAEAIAAQDETDSLVGKGWLAEALHFSSLILPQGVGSPFQPALASTAAAATEGEAFLDHCGLDEAKIETLLCATAESFDAVVSNFGQ